VHFLCCFVQEARIICLSIAQFGFGVVVDDHIVSALCADIIVCRGNFVLELTVCVTK
jgi:hypothetical protein